MAKGIGWQIAILKLLLNNLGTPGVGDQDGLRGSVRPGSLYLSLHSADPSGSGAQSDNELSYTGYARPAVVRSPSGFRCVGSDPAVGYLAEAVEFPECKGGAGTANFFAIGTDPTGAGMILYVGPCDPALNIFRGIIPRMTTDTKIIEF